MASGEGAGIEIDGPRPAVTWVTSLPRVYRVTPPEKLILLCLACDAYEWESAPGYDRISEWTGMNRSSCAEILGRLEKAIRGRPALIERISVRGRRRTVWRLLGQGEPSGPAGQLDRPATPDGSPSQPSGPAGRLAEPEPSANRPAPPDGSGANRRPTVGEPSGPAGRSLCPNPNVVESVSNPPLGGGEGCVRTRDARTPTRTRGARIPEDFQPNDGMLEWVRKECPDVPRSEHDRFVDYWRGKTGSSATKHDWPATWRNWMRRAQDDIRSGRRAPAGRKRSTTDQRVEAALDLAARYDAEDGTGPDATIHQLPIEGTA